MVTLIIRVIMIKCLIVGMEIAWNIVMDCGDEWNLDVFDVLCGFGVVFEYVYEYENG